LIDNLLGPDLFRVSLDYLSAVVMAMCELLENAGFTEEILLEKTNGKERWKAGW
jgi:hypothetical protein